MQRRIALPGNWCWQSVWNLAAEIDTDSDVVLEIYQNDVQKGVLSMKLEEKFRHPNGMEGTAEAVRTIIREKEEECIKRAVPGAVLPEPGGNARGGKLL